MQYGAISNLWIGSGDPVIAISPIYTTTFYIDEDTSTSTGSLWVYPVDPANPPGDSPVITNWIQVAGGDAEVIIEAVDTITEPIASDDGKIRYRYISSDTDGGTIYVNIGYGTDTNSWVSLPNITDTDTTYNLTYDSSSRELALEEGGTGLGVVLPTELPAVEVEDANRVLTVNAMGDGYDWTDAPTGTTNLPDAPLIEGKYVLEIDADGSVDDWNVTHTHEDGTEGGAVDYSYIENTPTSASDADPLNIGAADAGTSADLSRSDHIHAGDFTGLDDTPATYGTAGANNSN